MISIRQRKGIQTTEVSEDYTAQEENVKLEDKLPSSCTSRRLWKILSFTIGGTVALCIGLLTSVYLATLHENDLWFSNIKITGVGLFFIFEPSKPSDLQNSALKEII